MHPAQCDTLFTCNAGSSGTAMCVDDRTPNLQVSEGHLIWPCSIVRFPPFDVASEMFVSVAHVCKSGWADGAFVRFIAHVNPCVRTQVAGRCEPLGALDAAKLLCFRVDRILMPSQCTEISKGHVAVVGAVERPLAAVDTHVSHEVRTEPTSDFARGTDMRTLIPVNQHVSPEVCHAYNP
eukprot:CAMPEP_0170174970 /NCGR_PEP_ID=MMETSP0040_2-20121228/8137_1 /TAXON_ID=641309 /ORGANISM="Lotharella oceanica, Strain CCMP622" /LENGTH=179 /DNA_ID=CAMNT_0010416809 /DNA_START=109 /DNA_END=648 /DNA_ORIENTATION=+